MKQLVEVLTRSEIKDDDDGWKTIKELRALTSSGAVKLREQIAQAIEDGVMEAGKKKCRRIDGTVAPRPAYRLTRKTVKGRR